MPCVVIDQQEGSAAARPVSETFEAQEYIDDLWIEVCASEAANMLAHALLGPALAVWPIEAQGIPDIDHREDPRRQRDLLALQAARVAAAIPLFVVAIGDVQRHAQVGDRREQIVGEGRVLAHDRPLVVGERAGLEQNAVGDAHLADIVEQGAAPDMHQLGLANAHVPGQLHRQVGDSAGHGPRFLCRAARARLAQPSSVVS